MSPDADPFELFDRWFAEASEQEPNDPDAAALATATPEGLPSVRMVLVKSWDRAGFVFYTNLGSRKGRELAANPHAALCIHWKSMRRQVRVEGPVEPVSDEQADAYFASRPRASRLGAWASHQSQPMAHRFDLEKNVAEVTARHPLGPVPRPPFWSGFRILPTAIEFWENRAYRLHERIIYAPGEAGWAGTRLYP